MKKLNKYINESLLDDEDTQMDNLSNIAEMTHIKQLLDVSSRAELQSGIEKVMDIIKKHTKKVPYTKIDTNKIYIIFEDGSGHYSDFSMVTIWKPDGKGTFDMHQIICHDPRPDFTGWDDSVRSSNFTVFTNSKKSEMRKVKYHNFKTIFELPPKYFWMMDWISERWQERRKKF